MMACLLGRVQEILTLLSLRSANANLVMNFLNPIFHTIRLPLPPIFLLFFLALAFKTSVFHSVLITDFIFLPINARNFATKGQNFKFFLVFLCFIQIYVLHLRLSFGKCIGISVCHWPQGSSSHVHIYNRCRSLRGLVLGSRGRFLIT